MASYRYWRVESTATASGFFSLRELRMRATVGGTNIANTGTPQVSSSFFGAPNNAGALTDGGSAFWVSATSSGTHWAQIDFGSATEISEVDLVGEDATRLPTAFSIRGSNDGTTFTTLVSLSGLSGWVVGREYGYIMPDATPAGSYRYWRIRATETTDGYLSFGELQMRLAAAGPSHLVNGLQATASSSFGSLIPADAIDQDTSTRWISNTTVPPHWFAYDFLTAVDVVEFVIRVADETAGPNRAPRAWQIQASTDNATWTPITGYTQTTWVQNTPYTFTVTPGLGLGAARRRRFAGAIG